MKAPKQKFIATMEFKDEVYNKDTYELLSENYMEDYEEDTYAKMAIDGMLFDGHIGTQMSIHDKDEIKEDVDKWVAKSQFWLDFRENLKFIEVKAISEKDENNKKTFKAKFEFQAIPFTEETYGLLFSEDITWNDVIHKDITQFAKEDMRTFLENALMQEMKVNIEYGRKDNHNLEMLKSFRVYTID